MSNLKLVAKYYKGLEHQNKALDFLQTKISSNDWNEFLKIWRNENAKRTDSEIRLNVPFYSQLDFYTQQHRACNSASCAMFAKYFLPNSKWNQNDYLNEVLKRGDTTSHSVQTEVLRHFGIESYFSTTLSFEDLDDELERKRPVVICFLHRGSTTNPTGGHVIVVIGRTKNKEGYIVNDPYGNLNDGYTTKSINGKGAIYSKTELFYRWQLRGKENGWGRIYTGMVNK